MGQGLPFPLGSVGDPQGKDEAAPVHDGVVLVVQPWGLARPAGAPAGIGARRTEGQKALGILEIPGLVPFHSILVDAGFTQYEQAVFLNGLLSELLHGQSAAGQLVAVDVGLDQAGIGVHLR